MRILFTGGGTGGHIFPIVAIIRELKRIAEEERILDLEIFYMGPDDFAKKGLAEEEVFSLFIKTGKWRRYFSFANVLDVFITVQAILRALWNMFFIMPDAVFSKGGYGALPAVAAAWILKIPLIIHESDAVPGRVNLMSRRFAKRIAIAFPGAKSFFPKEKTAFTGVPIRKRILGGNKDEARDTFGIFSANPVIGIMGSSQGAQKINNAVLGILKELTDEFEILHQTGEKNYEGVAEESHVILESGNKEQYHPVGFMDEGTMRDFYCISDLIISRASATSIFEIAAWGKPSIIIPLRNAAQGHQRENAYEYAAEGACAVIEEENLSPHILFAEIKKVFGDSEGKKKMGEAAQRFSRIDSAEVIARELLKMGLH
ncbi:MAG: UDP-N-acetylglucosamine--N-acetylmuramyl-(pentapeptide) pyrophosphoryl-undecaprenol N-acetylglucosamine transferase [Candidatus Colwellbacteria bacterium]|nr:UDP-N-acetylglucosamine--N-acetylmuramyl-(pentapeptide) pyrophosphoryl-undecaprenol N-acetylglucosamine transferase [Candidatus Colwellbacteria bacterium]